MIEYRNGCVVEAFMTGEYIALLHQANCFNTMNSGVAKAIREVFPSAYAADCMTVKGDVNKLGTFSSASIDELNAYIVNLYGQYTYGKDGRKYTQVANLEHALKMFADKFRIAGDLNLQVCMPRMGCGLGGADWETELVPMIERQLIDCGFIVHVYDREGETCKSPNAPGIIDLIHNFRAARSVIEHKDVSSRLAPTSAQACVA